MTYTTKTTESKKPDSMLLHGLSFMGPWSLGGSTFFSLEEYFAHVKKLAQGFGVTDKDAKLWDHPHKPGWPLMSVHLNFPTHRDLRDYWQRVVCRGDDIEGDFVWEHTCATTQNQAALVRGLNAFLDNHSEISANVDTAWRSNPKKDIQVTTQSLQHYCRILDAYESGKLFPK